MKLHFYIFAILLICSSAFCGQFEILNEFVIDTIGIYRHLDPIWNQDGEFRGFIGTNANNDRLDIYNESGLFLRSISLSYNPIMTINYTTEIQDSIVIYCVQNTGSAGAPYKHEVIRLSRIDVSGDSYTINTITPDCHEGYGESPSSIVARIRFNCDDLYNVNSIVLNVRFIIKYWEITMGRYTDMYSTYFKYDFDLNQLQIRQGSYDYEFGFYGESNEIGSASIRNYLRAVSDDPWNSYNYSGSNFCFNIGANGVCRSTSRGNSSGLFRGDFIPASDTYEVIYLGNALDLLGYREDGKHTHIACYGIDSDTIVEEWYTLYSLFTPHITLPNRNEITGMGKSNIVKILDCSNGQISDSIVLNRPLVLVTFSKLDNQESPFLVGRQADTLCVYRLDQQTGVEPQPDDLLPNQISLAQNYPNPFNMSTTISFEIQSKQHVSLTIYNLLGHKVTRLVNKQLSAGSYETIWDGTNSEGEQVSTGIYLYKLSAGKSTITKKLVLLK